MAAKFKRADFRSALADIEALPAERQAAIRACAAEIVAASQLSEIRHLMDLTQQEVAAATNIRQGEISRIEKDPERAQLQTLRRYIEGIGGELRLVAVLPNGTRAEMTLNKAEKVAATEPRR